MPVLINEIIVRGVVDPKPASSEKSATDCDTKGPGDGSSDTNLIEKVLEVIREKNER